MNPDNNYQTPTESGLPPGVWLEHEKARLARLGLRSGQRFVFSFEKDQVIVTNLGRFEEPLLPH